MKRRAVFSTSCCTLLWLGLLACQPDALAVDMATQAIISAKAFNAQGDGVTDDTAAIQKALDETAKTGGRVYLPPAKYLVKGSLRIPAGVMLEGVHGLARVERAVERLGHSGHGRPRQRGGAGAVRDGPFLRACAASRFITRSRRSTNIHPYPWTVPPAGPRQHGRKRHPHQQLQRHPRRPGRTTCGIASAACTAACCAAASWWMPARDIGRIETCSSTATGGRLRRWAATGNRCTNSCGRICEAFIFGRTDWEYVNNTFVFPVNIGYRFIKTEAARPTASSPASAPTRPGLCQGGGHPAHGPADLQRPVRLHARRHPHRGAG